MSTITADKNTCAKLRELHETTQVVDEQGQLIGVFIPQEEGYYNQQIPDHIMKLFDFDEAEIERRRLSNQPGSSLKDVWERIHAREKMG